MAIRVLVIDDEATLRMTLSAYLEDDGFDVPAAASGEEALALLEQGPAIDVCIVDMRLPGISGHELILAMHARQQNLRFLIHTGSPGYDIEQDLKEIGIEDRHVFYKPVETMAHLSDAVRALVQERNEQDA